MKLRQLFENVYEQSGEDFDGSLKTIGVSFGRFNPPHKGHKAVWQAAATNPIWYVGTNESTSGPKDPLPYDVKLQAMAAVWPKVAGHVIPEQSLLTLASHIYDKHGSNVHLKVYTDEDWLVKTLVQYNGVEKEHGMYKFQQIDQVKTQRLASATNLRAAVRNGDRKAFYHDMGVKPSVSIEVDGQAHPLFDVVAHYLNQYPEKVKKEKAVAEEAAGVGIITKQNTTADVNAGTPRKNLDAFNLEESNMSELDIEIKDHLEKKLAMYRAGRLDAEVLGEYCVKLGHLLAKKHNLGIHWIQDAINDYVDDELGSDNQLHEARGGTKNINKTQQAAMKNATTIPALNMSTGSGGAYMNYRMGIAMAGAPDYPTKMEADNWIGGDPLLSTYTDEEFSIIKAAAKQVGAGTIQNWSGKRSQEVADVNKTSPVAKRKKNKYGV